MSISARAPALPICAKNSLRHPACANPGVPSIRYLALKFAASIERCIAAHELLTCIPRRLVVRLGTF